MMRSRLWLRLGLFVALLASMTYAGDAAYVQGTLQGLNPSTLVGTNTFGAGYQYVGCQPNPDNQTCALITNDVPSSNFVLTSASPTTCNTVINKGADMLYSITNSGALMTVTISIYLNEATPTCSAGDLFYNQILGNGQTVIFGPQYAGAGISYSLTGALSSNFWFSVR